jgi:hypothetical protein
MAYGYCFTRRRKDGTYYKICPGYIPAPKMKRTNLTLKKTNIDKIVEQLKMLGFKKWSRTVAQKMMKSGKGIENYSKTTGKLKKGH